MKRFVISMMSALLLVASLNAQSVLQLAPEPQEKPWESLPVSASVGTMTRSVATRATITADDDHLWWNNYDVNASGWYINGSRLAEHYNVATYIPRDLLNLVNTIAGIGFILSTNDLENVQVWISKTLPKYGQKADMETVDVDASELTYSFADVAFKSEHAIPEEGVYVGLSFDVKTAGKYPLYYTKSELNREGGLMYNTASNTEWSSIDGLPIMRLLLGGLKMSQNACKPYDFGLHYVVKGETVELPLIIENQGRQPITSIKYTISGDGSATESSTLDVSCGGYGSKVIVKVPVKASETAAAHQATLTITEVNGVANGTKDNQASGTVITMLKSVEAVPVIEEFTATWCGYCPYGIVGMRKAKEEYGDKVVLIAAHARDVMSTDSYQPILAMTTSYPNAVVNREENFYPTFSTIRNMIESRKGRISPAELYTSATWTNDGKTAIDIQTNTTFMYNANDIHYAIAYALVEDGMSDDTWKQRNYLSGGGGSDSDMQFWFNSPDYVSGIVFDYVAVDAWDIHKGISGSVPSSVTAGVASPFKYVANISANKLIQDKSKLSLVTMLVDSETGLVIHACQTSILDSSVIEGDINGSGSVDTDDVVGLVNYLTGNAPAIFNEAAADVNGDGVVNVTDIVKLINNMLQSR